MELKELMAAFAAETGMSELRSGEEGAYLFTVDDIAMMIAPVGDEERFALYAEIGAPPEGGREQVYRALLEASFPRGGKAVSTLSIDAETERICLHRTESLTALDYDGFKAVLEEFVNMADNWRKNLAAFPVQFTKVQGADDESKAEEQVLTAGEFMRV